MSFDIIKRKTTIFLFICIVLGLGNSVKVKAQMLYDSHEQVVKALKADKQLVEYLDLMVEEVESKNKEEQLKSYSLDDSIQVDYIVNLWKFNTNYAKKKNLAKMGTDDNGIMIPGYDKNNNKIYMGTYFEDSKYVTEDLGVNEGGVDNVFESGFYSDLVKFVRKQKDIDIKNISKIRMERIMELIYIVDDNNKSYVIPYNTVNSDMTNEMGLKEGKIYTEKQFTDAFKDTYKDWTDEEIEKYKKENSGKIGGADIPQLLKLTDSAKKRLANENNKEANSFLKMSNKTIVISAGIVVLVVLGVIVALLKKKKSNNN